MQKNSASRRLWQSLALIILFPLLFPLPAAGQSEAPAVTPLPALGQGSIVGDIAKTLQKQIQELALQEENQRQRLAKAQAESQPLAVAVSTHKTALSLDKIPMDQAKELLQYYGRLVEQKAKALEALHQDLEKYAKIQAELQEAVKKTALEEAAPGAVKTPAQRALEQQRQQYQALAKTAIAKLEEIQKIIQAQVALLTQEKTLLEDFFQQLETFVAEKARQQLLERQKPSDLLGLARELLLAGLALPQRLLATVGASLTSGAALALVQTYQRELVGLVIFLILILYSMHLLRRASREFRQKLAAQAQTFSLKLGMALINALASNYYLLALILWLALTLGIMQVLTRAASQIVLGGLVVLTGISLIRHLLQSILGPGAPDQGLVRRPDSTARFYYRYGVLTLSFLLSGYYLLWCLRLVGLEGSGYNFAVLLYLLVMIFWFIWLLRRPHLEILLLGGMETAPRSWLRFMRTLRLLVFLGLSAIIIVDLLGFQNLAIYLAGAGFLSLLALAGGWLLTQVAKDLTTFLAGPRGLLATGLELEAKTLETLHLVLGHTLALTTALLTAAGVFLSWGVDLRFIKRVAAALSSGPTVGPVTLSPLALVLAGASLWVARKLSRFSQMVLESGLFRRQQWDLGIQHTITNTVHYTLMTMGVLIALGFLGINFANLAIIVGGLGVGIGFGLQNIVNNFISGLILLVERPIKAGDLLVIDGQWGTVKAIRVRSTVFETVERSVLIIPNSELLSSKILNWTFYGRGPIRLALKVGVSYGSDVQQVTRILHEVCRQNHRVLSEPAPQVFFSAYGDSSLDFTIWVFLRSPADRVPATHELHTAIFQTFQTHGIEFPYPQLDVHVRTMPLPEPPPAPEPPVILSPDPEEQ